MTRYKVHFASEEEFFLCPATQDLLVAMAWDQSEPPVFLPGWYLFSEHGFGLDGPVETEEELWRFQREHYLKIEPLPQGHRFR